MKGEGISAEDINKYFFVRGKKNPFEDKLQLNIHIIRPKKLLGEGAGLLLFDPAEMKDRLVIGEMQAENFVARLSHADVDWA